MYCSFVTTLGTMLQDRLMCEINNENKLLSEKGLMYQKALGLAQSMETAVKNWKVMNS